MQSTIEIPEDAFPDDGSAFVFNSYSTNVLFQVVKPDNVNESDFTLMADTEVLGFDIPIVPNVSNLSMPIRITLQSFSGRKGEVSCVQVNCQCCF